MKQKSYILMNDREKILSELNQFPENVKKFLEVQVDKSDFPFQVVTLSNFLKNQNNEKINYLKRLALWGQQMAPHDPLIYLHAQWALNHLVPRWHFKIIHDEARNAIYEHALQKYVTPSATVLEIGSGTGILAMLAARAGAKHVYTCEMEPALAEVARENIRKNGFDKKITVIPKKSTELVIGQDLPERADLVVSELVDNLLLGENILPIMEDACARLLTPKAAILPKRVSANGFLVGGSEWTRHCRVNSVSGFDLSALNRFSYNVSRPQIPGELTGIFSEPVEIFYFEFNFEQYFADEQKSLEIPVTASGVVDGFLQWIKISFDDKLNFENAPLQRSCWEPILHLFSRPVQVKNGQKFKIYLKHDRSSIIISEAGIHNNHEILNQV